MQQLIGVSRLLGRIIALRVQKPDYYDGLALFYYKDFSSNMRPFEFYNENNYTDKTIYFY